MAQFELDLDFVIENLPKNGADLAIKALEFNHESLKSMMDAGLSEAIRKKSHYHARRFMDALVVCNDAEVSTGFLKRFLSGADPDEVNSLVMEKEPNDNNEVVAARWALCSGIQSDVFVGLMTTCKNFGADLNGHFSYSVYNEKGGRLGKHSLVSMLVGQSDYHMLTRRNNSVAMQDNEEIFHMKRVRELFQLGVSFDKATAAAMLQILRPENAMEWMHLFKEEGIATAQDMIKMTSRMKLNPEVLAVMQAEAAVEAVNFVSKNLVSMP
jgi:hypothetical protein